MRRLFTGQGGGVPPRTVSLPVGAGGVGVGAADVSASCLTQPPHPLPLGPASATRLQFPIHGVKASLQCQNLDLYTHTKIKTPHGGRSDGRTLHSVITDNTHARTHTQRTEENYRLCYNAIARCVRKYQR